MRLFKHEARIRETITVLALLPPKPFGPGPPIEDGHVRGMLRSPNAVVVRSELGCKIT
jgi:hypothetical protein